MAATVQAAFGVLVGRNHVRDVHPIDMIGAEDGHDIGLRLFDQIDVLVDGVRGSLIPGFVADRIWAGTGMMN